MKIKHFISVLILLLPVLLSAQFLPTSLRVIVLDDVGNVQKGATVTIYATEKDFQEGKNIVATGKTDDKGKLMFKNLSPKSYFIKAVLGKKDNTDGAYTTSILEAGKVNKINLIISE
jgi:uncharacterized protein (DUF2141 family)